MKKLAVFLVLALCIDNVSAIDTSPNGVYRPTLSTFPTSYLKKFPLGKATAEEIALYVGTPDKSRNVDGADYLTFELEPKSSKNVIEYTYVVKDDIVVNVTYLKVYLNSGSFVGVIQRESAAELQAR